MKKTFLIVLSLIVMLLMSSCLTLTVTEEPTVYQRSVVFRNRSNGPITLTVDTGEGESTYSIEANESEAADITAMKRYVQISVTGPYFYEYSEDLDLADTSRDCFIEPNAGIVFVKNYLSNTVTDVSFSEPMDGVVMYNQSLSPSDGNSIPRNETKAITATAPGGTKAHVYFRKADGKMYYTCGNGMSDKGLFTSPENGKFITVVLTDNNTDLY